jgi:maltooligosyltrehalose trehalohydrolase
VPDPRAGRLPHGVSGPGRRVDPRRFRWSDAGWRPTPLEDALLYELHVGTFSPEGTFAGAAARLPALVELGVTHVSLMPVHSFPGRHGWGYDSVGLFAPHEPYGGPEGLAGFVDAAHAHGLGVILDVVYNHFGPSGNHLPRFGPYLHDRHRTPWGEAVNLDGPGSAEVRRFLCDNALQWLRDYHCDGLRLDAVHALCDDSPRHFLAQLREEVDALAEREGRPRVLIAESDLNDPVVVTPIGDGGWGMHAQWSDDFHHALHALLTGERSGYYAGYGSLAELARALESGFVYDGGYSAFRGRCFGRPFGSERGERLLGYLQTHDQVGNRPLGERSSALLDPHALRLAAALVLLSPFVPQLFQGEEWGASTPFLYFADHAEPALRRAIAEGRRRDLPQGVDAEEVPDPHDPDTFLRSRLDWDERARAPHAGLLDWHRRLIALRRAEPDLREHRLDRTRVRGEEPERWLCVARGRCRIAANLGDAVRVVPLDAAPEALLAESLPGTRLAAGGVELPPRGLAVLRVRGGAARRRRSGSARAGRAAPAP